MWGYLGSSGLGMSGMGLGMFVFWIVLGVGFALLVRYATGNGGSKHEHALDILEQRYARGEIGHDEFERKKHDLEE